MGDAVTAAGGDLAGMQIHPGRVPTVKGDDGSPRSRAHDGRASPRSRRAGVTDFRVQLPVPAGDAATERYREVVAAFRAVAA